MRQSVDSADQRMNSPDDRVLSDTRAPHRHVNVVFIIMVHSIRSTWDSDHCFVLEASASELTVPAVSRISSMHCCPSISTCFRKTKITDQQIQSLQVCDAIKYQKKKTQRWSFHLITDFQVMQLLIRFLMNIFKVCYLNA